MNGLNWNRLRNDCIDFVRRLIQTPSMSHEEADLAAVVAQEMRSLAFDDVWLDEVGNVYGRVKGREPDLGALVLNSHLDHVDPGDLSLWPAPPYAADVIDGRIVGRGACDIKGPLAVQIYSMAGLRRSNVRPRRDVVFTGVVQEEIGGAGAVHWVSHLDYPVDLVVLGEPSSNHLSLGHRGILQVWVKFSGRSVHASVPDEANNPNYALASFLARLHGSRSELSVHPLLGETTVAPTIIEVDTKSLNVTPAWTRVLLDIRTASESPNSLYAFIKRLAGDAPCEIGDAWAEDPDAPAHRSEETIFGYFTDPESETVQRTAELVTRGMGWSPDLTSYRFATDGRHFVPYGIPIIGYSPGEEHLAHTVNESISIEMIDDSLRGHIELLRQY